MKNPKSYRSPYGKCRNPVPKIVLVGVALALCLPAWALERWAALSQIESGDKDDAVGAAGEISRYQMKPEIWRRFASARANWENPSESLAVAQEIVKERIADFERSFRRAPTDLEFYILWNAPAQIRHPSQSVRDRAERFCNLVNSP